MENSHGMIKFPLLEFPIYCMETPKFSQIKSLTPGLPQSTGKECAEPILDSAQGITVALVESLGSMYFISHHLFLKTTCLLIMIFSRQLYDPNRYTIFRCLYVACSPYSMHPCTRPCGPVPLEIVSFFIHKKGPPAMSAKTETLPHGKPPCH